MDDDVKVMAPRAGGNGLDGAASKARDHVDRLACAVFERLRGVPDREAVDDPQRVLFAIAADAERSMPAETSIRGEDSEDEARRFYQRRVDTLEPHCKEMLLLHVNEGLTYKQIAERLGRSTKDVLGHLIRAYCTLRHGV